MNIESDLLIPFLVGEQFSNGLEIDVQGRFLDQNRVDYLVGICRGKRVIHLGCTDHIPVIKPKLKRGEWLHKRITDVAEECLGVDIDEEAITYVRKLGFNNILVGDVTKGKIPEIASQKWDLIIVGEVLEHTNNPVNFLSSIKKNYTGIIDQMVVTVPNALNFQVVSHLKKGTEVINSDHRYWFSPYTIKKVFHEAGISNTRLSYCNRIMLNFWGLVKRKIFSTKTYPFSYFQTIVALGKL